MSAGVKQDVLDAVASGYVAILPTENLQRGDWSGTGYILLDKTTGAGGYMLAPGIAGSDAEVFLRCCRESVHLVGMLTNNQLAQSFDNACSAYDMAANLDEIAIDAVVMMMGMTLLSGILAASLAATIAAAPTLGASAVAAAFLVVVFFNVVIDLASYSRSNPGGPGAWFASLLDDCLELARRVGEFLSELFNESG